MDRSMMNDKIAKAPMVVDEFGSFHGQDIQASADALCARLGEIEADARLLVATAKAHASYTSPGSSSPRESVEATARGESIAQAMLALRHVEYARMRIDKVLLYAQGGVSKLG